MYDTLYDKAGKPHFTGHLPGYTGYCPGKRYTEGLTFGATTEQINKKVRDHLETQFSEPRGPRCTEVPRYSTCHGLPMSTYRERPQTGTVFADKKEVDRLMTSLQWYSRSAKERSLQGRNTLLPHRYKLKKYPLNTNGMQNGDLSTLPSGRESHVTPLPTKLSCSTQSDITFTRHPRRGRGIKTGRVRLS